MTITRAAPLTALALLASFLAVGIPYWRVPYAEASLPSTLQTPALLVVALAALLLCRSRVTSWWRATWMLGASVAAAVLVRVVVETTQDPTSHNLWPFEIVIALFIGLPSAFVGAFLGSLLARRMPERRGESRQ